METWGIGAFENDMALDWLEGFESNDFRLIDRTLAGVAEMVAADYLDTTEACEVLAAAECVAAAGGFPTADLPKRITRWVAENSPIQVKPEFVIMAQKAVARVQNQSELRDLWMESEKFAEWETAVADLQHRLSQIPGV